MITDRAMDRLRDAASWPELDARYEITGIAGYGGMGTVYVARDHVLDRDVAVKVLDIADQKGARAARLRREAHILARLDHPGIVPVHDAGTLEDGRAFYVMKVVKGRRLDELIADRLPLDSWLTMFGRILDAVAFAHAHGIVHRDLKPQNVMVGGFGEVYVMDWGVAQDGAADPEPAIVGTPGFMAPEQAAAGDVDPRADIYALGILLAFAAGEHAPAPLHAIAQKARHADANYRYQKVEDLGTELARFRNHEPVDAYKESLVERLVRVYRRYELAIVLLVAYIVMRFVLLMWRGV